MTTHAQTHKLRYLRFSLVDELGEIFERLVPRRCMVIAVGVILTGLSIPMLMAIQMLPVTWLFGITSLSMITAGGILALIFCGEI